MNTTAIDLILGKQKTEKKRDNMIDAATVDYRFRAILRKMAWERAKGELQSILAAHWDDGELVDYGLIESTIHEFIEKIENDTTL